MSLILEALRRSEAERQLGRAPDVLTPMPLLRVSGRARRWPWWLGLALLLAALLGWIGWRHTQHELQIMVPDVSASSAMLATPQASIEPAAHRARAALPSPIPQSQIEVSRPAAKSLTPSPPVAPSARPIASAPTAIAPPIDTVFSSEAGHPTAAANGVDAAPADADVLLSIADLSPAERQALPALKVSMHVYTEQPGDRFMIVDGARVGEGARIGDRIVLVRIRRDGGVLDIGGRRLLLPKP